MRIFSVITIITLLVVSTPVFAASVADVVMPLEKGNLSVSAEDTYVFARDLNDADTKVDSYNQAYANIAYGLTDNIKVYTKLGMADMNINGKTSDNKTTKEEYGYGFLWGAGLSANYEFEDGWLIGLDGQYSAWDTDFVGVKLNGENARNPKGKLKNREWQAAIFAAREIPLNNDEMQLLPYVGVKYADFAADYQNLQFTTPEATYLGVGKVKNDKKIGAVCGVGFNINKNFKANIEGQFLDEMGVTGGLTYLF